MSLLRCACGIDVRAHAVPEDFPAYLGKNVPSPWPTTAPAPGARGLCHRHVLVGGKHYRTLDERSWSPARRLDDFPAMGLAAASVITGGLLQRLPALRIAFSHGGGTLAMLLPRLQQGWSVFPALRDSIAESPIRQAQCLFYDTLVFDPLTLRHLVACFGASQLLLGTDHPFNFHERAPLARLDEAGLDAATARALAFGNARRFLGRAAAHLPELELA